jgi:transcriptional regulator with XRE-family HTH domain
MQVIITIILNLFYFFLREIMEELNKVIGKRLQDIRKIYNNGFRCSVEQLASELGESPANIRNYECGKAGVPNRLLLALYYKGINPIYIITGEGPLFAPNEEGAKVAKHLKDNKQGNVELLYRILPAKGAAKKKAVTVAAGLIADGPIRGPEEQND